ncbi:type I polyketide synthase [Nannocystis radixulma]|uniref:Beta-ketoacyl synthase N-terminal-like domain-containing protein n=1 Tax=Nannocystis radixulma TaxID=2995305 RepID=A0ABT5B3W2_9BACT|nr:type I polyketide synthase [Nannocystis radixulma]MDC0667761.1 beta-ketoacyl synthase N-terminal-like domain-containing protein [Nannocystis radixulma]
MTSPIDEYRARLRTAMERMNELRDALAAERRARREPIAIIGVGGRFPPDRHDPEQFFAALLRGEDATGERPPARGGSHQGFGRGGWLHDVRGFDAAFFGISPREAAAMDPQQRLLLECTWEALERAGRPADQLADTRVGVFVGLCANDYLGLALDRGPAGRDIYALTGNGHAFAAGRLAFTFGFQGPCLTVDTACSSSLVAVHLAVRSLRDGDSHLAVAAGVHLLLSPTSGVLLAQSGALAPDGRCKTFDAAADGFTRGEGCGVVVLKRLADARRDGDPVLAVIRGTATNQDGRQAGFTAPSVLAQEAMLRHALADAGLAPEDIGYVETHGTGTALGDPIELAALAAVFGGPRQGPPCILGAVKTNLGHLEAAAGVVGLIKATLCLQRGVVPPNLHFHRLNPHAAGAPFTFPTAPHPWPAGAPRRAGVSSFGMSGSNAHVVLEAAPPDDLSPETASSNLSPGTSAPSSPDLSPRTASTGTAHTPSSGTPAAPHLSQTPSPAGSAASTSSARTHASAPDLSQTPSPTDSAASTPSARAPAHDLSQKPSPTTFAGTPSATIPAPDLSQTPSPTDFAASTPSARAPTSAPDLSQTPSPTDFAASTPSARAPNLSQTPSRDASAPPQLLTLSARDPAALTALAALVGERLRDPEVDLADLCHTAAVRRSHHPHRLALVGSDPAALARDLAAFAAGDRPSGLQLGHVGDKPRPVFVFSGQGAAWPGMADELLAEPAARAALEACDAEFAPFLRTSILAEIRAPAGESRLHHTAIAQPALFAVAVALTAQLRAWGVEPHAVIGHSVGEIAAAHVAGALGLADAARLVCARGDVMQRAAGQGAMAAVDLSPETAARALAGRRDLVAIAAINGPDSCVLAGAPAALDAVLAELQAGGARVRRLRVDYAFHSPQMAALQPLLRERLGTAPVPRRAALRLFSTVTGAPVDGTELGPDHWVRGLAEPVQFAAAVGHALAAGHRLFIEVGPHPTLVADLRACAGTTADALVVPTLWRDRPARPALLRALAELHVAGQPLGLAALFPGRRRLVALPTYPWQRRDHWLAPVPATFPEGHAPSAIHAATPPSGQGAATFPEGHAPSAIHAATPPPGQGATTFPEGHAPSAIHAATPRRGATTFPEGHAPSAILDAPLSPAQLSALRPGTEEHAPSTMSNTTFPQGHVPSTIDPAPATPALRETLRRAAPEARRSALLRPVRAEIAGVLGLGDGDPLPPRQGLFDLGLDSMMAVELRQRLERRFDVRLAATLVFEHPTLDNLAGHIADALGALEPAAAPTVPTIAHDEPIAVVGMACRFPGGANDPEAYWQLLCSGADAIVDVPPDRWDGDAWYDPDPGARGKIYARRSGFLQDVDVAAFDAAFFRIAPAEARALDPQQRLLLELAWEALEDAGQSPDPLVGSRTGVFVGIATADYAQLAMQAGVADMDPYVTTGTAPNTAAGRISHFLGLRGPAVALDTACSSSLVATHLGCQSLRRGECDLVLVGGVNLMLSPVISVMYARMGTLAPDSRCKAFDRGADGMVRGEGGGMLVLKRLSAARRDGDRVHAVIRGVAVNHDGRSGGLTVPSGSAQRDVLRAALHAAGLAPASVAYVETHGTGTALGDPIEANALLAELGRGRPQDRPLHLGAAKASIGHLEAAAGVAGLIKAILAVQRRQIPPQRNFTALNPAIDPAGLALVVPTELTPWPDGPAIAGVSSFGMSGTNAHVLLEAADPVLAHTADSTVSPFDSDCATDSPSHSSRESSDSHSLTPQSALESSPHSSRESPDSHSTVPRADQAPEQRDAPLALILPISARTPAALRSLAVDYRRRLADPTTDVAALCAAASLRRAHLEHRLALTGTHSDELLAALDAYLVGDLHPGWSNISAPATERPRLAFVFAGHSGHWIGMGRTLYSGESVFRAALDACARALAAHRERPLLDDLFAADADQRWQSAEVLQPVVLAVQLALAEQWIAWGIVPQAVVGHSMGELAAACVAGALDLGDAFRICVHRSRLLDRLRGRGAMASVALPPDRLAEHLAPHADRIAVAAANSPQLTVLSGDPDALRELARTLAARNVFVRPMPGATAAGHSPQLDPLLPELAEALAGLASRPTRIPFYSTITADLRDGDALGPDYWLRNLREPVRFADTLVQLAGAGIDTWLEVSPSPLLLGAIEQTLRPRGGAITRLGSLKADAPERAALLASLGRLWAGGLDVDWSQVWPGCRRAVALPSYPWQRQRHWLALPAAATTATAVAPVPAGARHTVAARTREHLWDLRLDAASDRLVHVQGIPVHPLGERLELVLAAHEHLSPGTGIALADLDLGPPLALDMSPGTATQPAPNDLSPATAKTSAATSSNRSPGTATQPAPNDLSPATAKTSAATSSNRSPGTATQPAPNDLSPATAKTSAATSSNRSPETATQPAPNDLPLATANTSAATSSNLSSGTATQPAPNDLSLATANTSAATSSNLSPRTSNPTPPAHGLSSATPAPPVRDLSPGTSSPAAPAVHLSPGTSPCDLQLVLDDPARSDRRFELHLRRGDAPWRLHATGRTLLATAAAPSFDLPAAERRCSVIVPDLRATLRARGLELPAALWAVDRSTTAPRSPESLARLLPAVTRAAALESGLQLLADLAHETGSAPVEGELFVPADVDTVWVSPDPLPPVWAHAALRGPAGACLGACGDLHLLDRAGRPVLVLGGVRLDPPDRGLARRAVDSQLARWLYALEWESGPTPSPRHEPGTWVLLPDPGGLARALADRLLARGDRCLTVDRGDDLDLALARARGDLRGVLDLRGLDLRTHPSVPAAVARATRDLLHLVHALVRPGIATRIAVLTRGAEPVRPGPLDLAAGPLWGLARTIPLDHPELAVKLLDLDPRGGDDLDALLAEIDDAGPEDLVAHRDGDRLVARLVRTPAPPTPPPLALRPDATYLITGGLGGVGLQLARWLVDRGARHLVLLGRRGLSQTPSGLSPAPAAHDLSSRSDPSREPSNSALSQTPSDVSPAPAPRDMSRETFYLSPAPAAHNLSYLSREPSAHDHLTDLADRERRAVLRHLEQAGARVRVVAADVADPHAMAAVLADIPREHPLRGVFHAAGTSAPQPLARTSDADLAALLRPKVEGAWVLHTLTRDLPLDQFVGFSSAAATWGAALLGPYSAANHFLDLLAHHRRALGLPGLSVNWGGWSGGGMSTADVQRYAADMGLVMTPAVQFIEALDILLQAGVVQRTVATVDWQIFKPVLEARGPRPLLARIAVERLAAGDGLFARRLAAAPAGERWDLLVEHVRERAAAILGFTDPRALDRYQGFFQLGMDSVMSVRLRGDLERSLGASLPPTLAFEQPSVDALAGWLARELLAIAPPIAPELAAPEPTPDPTAELRDLSEAELAALLAAELDGT